MNQKWKNRHFDTHIRNYCLKASKYSIHIYLLSVHIKTLDCLEGDYIFKIFNKFGRHKDNERDHAVNITKDEVSERLSSLPRETLVMLIEELEDDLEPSVNEFFDRYIESTESKINTELLLKDLITKYNILVRETRKKA